MCAWPRRTESSGSQRAALRDCSRATGVIHDLYWKRLQEQAPSKWLFHERSVVIVDGVQRLHARYTRESKRVQIVDASSQMELEEAALNMKVPGISSTRDFALASIDLTRLPVRFAQQLLRFKALWQRPTASGCRSSYADNICS